jgi:hypothetical protein
MKEYFSNFYQVKNSHSDFKDISIQNNLMFSLEYENFMIDVLGKELKEPDFDLCKIDPSFATGHCPFFISVDEFFSFDEIKTIWEWEYASDFIPKGYCPIAEVQGGSLILIGIDTKNMGQIFYHSYDFGFLKLADTLKEFLDSCTKRVW